jgi:hypothetical protein
MKTLKELADLGAAAAFADNKRYHYMSVSKQSHSWQADEPARQAFAQAVLNAVMDDMLPKADSGTSTKTVPLDINDIRATDEFKLFGGCVIQTLSEWDAVYLRLSYGGPVDYSYLATSYLRRQHGSTEWKPCTKESQP